MSNARVKINVRSGELDFEGSEDFVKEQMDQLEAIVDIIAQLYVDDKDNEIEEFIQEERKEVEESKLKTVEINPLDVPDTFGEWQNRFADDTTDLDKALITAYFVQVKSEQNEFKTKEVSDTLKEHGIKLSNPSSSLDRLTEKKLTFQVRKLGKLKFLRVSANGLSYLKTLIRT
ncbi:hypothetical protein ABE33_18405 [Bacillus safensis]|uniref:hypothetical protein n=1 Tax=Bacillus TaxID=1386 RepID=UPI000468D445|nr:hypothetical protein [Bacillus safensis]KIL20321.1 hypothetical protein B4134_3817 [Bacillus safensis]MBG9823099.1 hypothetical protein [Bacillus safensis]MBG9834019.1 hypothetical protein [Bacillus safensis]MBG9862974.1 hypothetical protein [Bacillus safensis]MBG9898899.1 hypothetical protein [Bacillus safensis]